MHLTRMRLIRLATYSPGFLKYAIFILFLLTHSYIIDLSKLSDIENYIEGGE